MYETSEQDSSYLLFRINHKTLDIYVVNSTEFKTMNLLRMINFDYTESQRRAYLTNINDLVYLTEEDVYFVSTINENIEFDV